MFHPTSFPSEWLLTNVQRISYYNTWHSTHLYYTSHSYVHSQLILYTSHSYVHSHHHSFISSALRGWLAARNSLCPIQLCHPSFLIYLAMSVIVSDICWVIHWVRHLPVSYTVHDTLLCLPPFFYSLLYLPPFLIPCCVFRRF